MGFTATGPSSRVFALNRRRIDDSNPNRMLVLEPGLGLGFWTREAASSSMAAILLHGLLFVVKFIYGDFLESGES